MIPRWIASLFPCPSKVSRRQRRASRADFRPRLEALEERLVPATYDVSPTGTGTSSLQGAIAQANQDNSADTIVLAKGTYDLSNQLVVTATNALVIQGATGTASDVVIDAGGHNRAFVISGSDLHANVTFEALTIQNGLASDSGVGGNTAAEGGAILVNQEAIDGSPFLGGYVTLSNVVVQNNKAVGNAGKDALGGGVFVSAGGQLTVENGTVIRGNQAIGGNGVAGVVADGNAEGGGVYVNGTDLPLTVDSSSITGNEAIGGNGANGNKTSVTGQAGGAGQGGGVYINILSDGLALSLTGATLTDNTAQGGQGGQGGPSGMTKYGGGGGGPGGDGAGGGVYLSGLGSVTIGTSTSTGIATTMSGNAAIGGAGGGAGEADGDFSDGGDAYGGALYAITELGPNNEALNVSVNAGTVVQNNTVDGGTNSDGGDGGEALGGGIFAANIGAV